MPLTTGERDYVFLLVDLDSEEIVGVEVEDVRAWALNRHPNWKALIGGVSEESRPVQPAMRAALATFLADIVEMANT